MRLSETEKARPFFDFEEGDLCTVIVQPIARQLGQLSRFGKEYVIGPQIGDLGSPTEYQLHPGYRRVLAGLTREIEFMTTDKLSSHLVVFRAVYLIKVLDCFADELQTMPRRMPQRFRSRALNPILQRQMRGLADHEGAALREAIGNIPENVAKFYLTWDPLSDPGVKSWQENFIYDWPVRASFSLLKKSNVREEDYEAFLTNTKYLVMQRAKVDVDRRPKSGFWDFEQHVIVKEALQPYIPGFKMTTKVRTSCRSLDECIETHQPLRASAVWTRHRARAAMWRWRS